ncbi:MAG: hypothetical protein ACXWL5_00840 [Candidatus Chromulinivorax sp.]
MKNSTKISIQLFILQCFWALHTQAEQMPITTLYCHGLCGDSSQINDYKDLIAEPAIAINFPDTQKPSGINLNSLVYTICTKLGKANINRENMFMGYGLDIETIHKNIDSTQSYILFGLCRGGAAIVNYLAKYNPENIRAIVLDEAPANIVEIMTYRAMQQKKSKAQELSPIQKEQAFRFYFPGYPRNAKPTAHQINFIKNKELVVVLTYSPKKSTFHFPPSTWNMYKAFKRAGFKNIYLCELPDYGQKAEGLNKLLYQQYLNSVYKKHNLPYQEKYAVLTEEQLVTLQPTVQEIKEIIKNYQF